MNNMNPTMNVSTFADLLGRCAPADGGTPNSVLIGVWPVREREPEQCDIGCCRHDRAVMLTYLRKKQIYVLFLCEDHGVEMARPKDGDLLKEFAYRVLCHKDRQTLANAARRPSDSKRLREHGLTTSAGTLTRLGREVLARV